MLIANSQGKEFDIANFNVLLLPGDCVRHVLILSRKKKSYATVVLFIGGNDVFYNNVTSTKPAEGLTQKFVDLANLLPTKVKSVFVLAIPPRLYIRDPKL